MRVALESKTVDFAVAYQVCKFLSELSLDEDYEKPIAEKLIRISHERRSKKDFRFARECLLLAEIKFRQFKSEARQVDCQFQIALCFEEEADSIKGSHNSFANHLYTQAIQAYRRIKRAHRPPLKVDEKIESLKLKVSDTGKATFNDMAVIKTPVPEGRAMAEEARNHVSEKQSPRDAIIYFTGVFRGFEHDRLIQKAKGFMQTYLITSMLGSTHQSRDGRVVARVPPASFSGDKASANAQVIEKNVLMNFTHDCQILVQAHILPALNQILKEHSIERELLVSACYYSPIVPENREQTLANALWAGFEYEFSSAIHLLCPQVENIVRVQLANNGVNTKHVDVNGLSSEMGLGWLLEQPQCEEIFGKDMTFELKATFTHPLGFNLRNDVAHGLLDDNSAYEISSVYAWWLILKLVIRSILDQT